MLDSIGLAGVRKRVMNAARLDTVLEAPPGQASQYSADGSSGQDVNLFRGTVSFSVLLLSLPGRSGLNLELLATYNSAVSGQVVQSNRDAPTGILGLGWDMPIDRIDAHYAVPGDRNSVTFFLTSRGSRNRLYRVARPWQRGCLDISLSASLDRKEVTPAVQRAFLDQGLVLDRGARVTVDVPGQSWSVVDPVNAYMLVVRVEAGSLSVLDGGFHYEAEGYDFSRVCYYAPFERWEIYDTSGLCRIFGGASGTNAAGHGTSQGDSIVWGVHWNGWAGPGMVAHDPEGKRIQAQYPLSWYVSAQRAPNRDEIRFAYRQVQPLVGVNGLPFTRAIYLETVTDMFGRSARLIYAPKQYSSDMSGVREYLDPHRAVPDDAPTAWQDRYETLFLDRVECRAHTGDLLFTTCFTYELGLFAAVPDKAPPDFAGTMTRRVLTAITRVQADGSFLPPLRMTYYPATGSNPGAIASRHLPEGAVVAYDYQQKSLTQCSRSLTVLPALASARPRVWFGTDYAVVLWIADSRFSLTVYTWNGRWIAWTPSAQQYLLSIDPDGINPVLRDDFFVLHVPDADKASSCVLFFHRDNRILGGWIEDPASPLGIESRNSHVVAGDRFLAIANGQNNTVTWFTWNDLSRSWTQENVPTEERMRDPSAWHIFLAANATAMVVLYYDGLSAPGTKQSRLVCHGVGETGDWTILDTRPAPDITISGPDVRANFHWVAASWVFAAASVIADTGSRLTWQLSLYTWKPDRTLNAPFQIVGTIDKTETGILPWQPIPVILPSGLVACGPNLLRFNGREWLPNNSLSLRIPVRDGAAFRFVAGDDVVVKTEYTPDQVIGMLQAFDPDTAQSVWAGDPLLLYDGAPVGSGLQHYGPSAGGNTVTFGDHVYDRGASTDWKEAARHVTGSLPPDVNTATLVNQGPLFLLALGQENAGRLMTRIMVLKPGFIFAGEVVPQALCESSGPGSFATFLPADEPFDQAQSLTLYRFLHDSVLQPVADFPVRSVTSDNGYTREAVSYLFDPDTAALSAQGDVCKYYTVAVSRGPGGQNGSTRYTFMNGIGDRAPGNPVREAVLDGQLLRTDMHDAGNRVVASYLNTWSFVDQVQDIRDGTTRRLHGGYVQLTSTTRVVDGVTSSQSFAYDLRTGQVMQTDIAVLNSVAQTEVHRRRVVPGWQRYPQFGFLNILTPWVEITSTVTTGDAEPVVTGQALMEWCSFPGPAIGDVGRLSLFSEVQAWSRVAAGGSTPSEDPAQWLRTGRVEHRNAYGYHVETRTSSGLVQSELYATAGSPLVATFSGASLSGQEAYYYGFEPYETAGNWNLDPARTPLVTAISCTGTRCMAVPAGVSGASLELTPRDRSEPFLFSFWACLDPAARVHDPVECWRVEYTGPGAASLPTPRTVRVASTQWSFYAIPVDLSGCQGPVTVRLTPVNSGNVTVFIDNVAFSTRGGSVRAHVFDPVTYRVTAEVGPYNQIRRRIYDRQQRQVAITNEFQSVVNVIAPYLARQTQDGFDPDTPNSQLVVQPMGDTWYGRFRNNGVWSDGFSSTQPTLWTSANGQLAYHGDQPGRIDFTGIRLVTDYMVRLTVKAEPGHSVGLMLGDDLAVAWNPDTCAWTLTDRLNKDTVHGAFTSPTPSGDWLVVLGPHAVIMALDGRILFRYLPEQCPQGRPAFVAGGPLVISEFVAGSRLQMAIRYFDGCGRTTQGHSVEGTQVVIATTLYDELGRPDVQLKPVALDIRRDGFLFWRRDLVTAFDRDSGLLSGKAADAWPQDQGYPYTRKRFEPSPLGRVVETGMPGRDFAIVNLSTRTPEGRHTVRWSYGANTDDAPTRQLGLPVGRYACVQKTDQNGDVSVTMTDTLSRAVATARRVDSERGHWTIESQATVYTPDGVQQAVRLPNFYALPSGGAADAWTRLTLSDLSGRIISRMDPDSGLKTAVFNAAGHVRFARDAVTAARGDVVYSKYDRYGRPLETGLVAADWDRRALQARAEQPDWPRPEDGARALRRFVHDGDGTSVNNLGHLVSATECDETSRQATSVLVYDHDDTGQVAGKTLRLPQLGRAYATTFTYDNLGNVTGITYPSGFTVLSQRDAVGRVERMVDGNGTVLAAWTYAPGDQIAEQRILPGAQAAVTTDYAYNSPGWPVRLSSAFMTEELSYNSGAMDGTAYYNGQVSSIDVTFSLPALAVPGFPARTSTVCRYDSGGRILSARTMADGVVQPRWSFGVVTPTSYDDNGNVLSCDHDGQAMAYRYRAGTNQVINTDGSDRTDYVFDAVGAVTRADSRAITDIVRHPGTRRVDRIRTTDGDVAFEYDSRSNRIVKTTTEGRRVYVRGVNGWTVMEEYCPASGTPSVTEYLYGPGGLFAIRVDGQVMPVLTDHLGSVRGLVADGRLSSAFHYNVFGEVVARYGAADHLRYRFTGYEYDAETGLYNASARLYDPVSKRFYSVDPKGQYASSYVYCGNNPVSLLDPTGEAAWWAVLLGALVGTAVTLFTGGAGAFLFATEEGTALGASTAVSAAAGAVGSLAGDATAAGASGERFTPVRALVDLAAGAAGGAAGEFFGGTAANAAIGRAFRAGYSAAAVSRIGFAASGVAGGLSGSAAAIGTQAALGGQPLFSAGNGITVALSALAGFGGAVAASGSYFSWFGNTMPVPLGENDFDLIDAFTRVHPIAKSETGHSYRFLTLNREELGLLFSVAFRLNESGTEFHDVIDVHGAGRFVFPSIKGAGYMRPMSAKLLARYMRTQHPDWVGGGTHPPIKMSCCFSAIPGSRGGAVGQTIATALNRTTYGSLGTVRMIHGAPDWKWVRFTP